MVTQNLQNKKGSRITLRLPCMLVLAALSIAATAGAQEIRAKVDRALVNFPDVQPMMVNGRVMVPVRGVFEHMNATVTWDAHTRVVTAQRGTDLIRLPLNSFTATVNDRQVTLDSPANVRSGRTMVPLRFLSESLGASVEWMPNSRTVEINTMGASNPPNPGPGNSMMRMEAGTVIPFRLNERLSSNGSTVGDRFTASLDTGDSSNYQGMNSGATLEGHVDVARAKSGDIPGVLGLAFDRLRTSDGQVYQVHGSLIGLDSKSVDNENGRLVAKTGAKNDNLKYVGYGAGGGALIAILTKGNIISNSLIGAALGFLYSEIKKDPSQSSNVTSEAGKKFGVRLTRDLTFMVPMTKDRAAVGFELTNR